MTSCRLVHAWRWMRGLLGLAALACAPALSQEGGFERLPAPAETVAPGIVARPAGGGACLIDLPTALRLADRANPDIGISRQEIEVSLAALQQARVILLPSLTAGSNYHQHTGNLQRSGGAILSVDSQSLYYGGGAQAIGANTVMVPAIRIFAHVGDAYFEPLAARQQTVVRRFDARSTFNTILLNVCTRYVELIAAESQLELLRRSQQDAAEAVRISADFARVGQGRAADANRMQTEASLIDSEVQRRREQQAVAAAELARLLNLDPSAGLATAGGPMPMLELVNPVCRLDQLVDVALRQRPDLAARNASVAEAETRYRQERTRPLLPTVSVSASAGEFGGGSNLVVPTFGSFSGRTDCDAFAYWTLRNAGIGNLALWRTRRALTDQAVSARTRTINLIRREVAEAHAQVTATRQEVVVNEQRLLLAEGGYAAELRRIRGGEGLPIELLDSLTRLVRARQALITAIAAYDRAEFQLFVALGQPPPLELPSRVVDGGHQPGADGPPPTSK